MYTFLRGFRSATGLSGHDADESWAAYSRQLSDAMRRKIEAGGFRGGQRMGYEFRRFYPADKESPIPDGYDHLPTLHCLRCDHTWHPRKSQRPGVCPKCKKYTWDRPVPKGQATAEGS